MGESPTGSNPFAFVGPNQNKQWQNDSKGIPPFGVPGTSYPMQDGFNEKMSAMQPPPSSLEQSTSSANAIGQLPANTGSEAQRTGTHFQPSSNRSAQTEYGDSRTLAQASADGLSSTAVFTPLLQQEPRPSQASTGGAHSIPGQPDRPGQTPQEPYSTSVHQVHNSHWQSTPSAMLTPDVFSSYVRQDGSSSNDFTSSLQPQSLPVQQNSLVMSGSERVSSSAPSTRLQSLLPATDSHSESQLSEYGTPRVTNHHRGQSLSSMQSEAALQPGLFGARVPARMQNTLSYQPPNSVPLPDSSGQQIPSSKVASTDSQKFSENPLKQPNLEEPTGTDSLLSSDLGDNRTVDWEKTYSVDRPPSDLERPLSSNDQYVSSSYNNPPLPPERPLSNADMSSTTELQLRHVVDRHTSYPVLGTNAELTSHLLQHQQSMPQTNATPFVPLLPKDDNQSTPSPKKSGEFALPVLPSNAPLTVPVIQNNPSKFVQGPEVDVRNGIGYQPPASLSVHTFEGEAAELDYPHSLSSSMNQSISSLLDSQEDFARLSPVKLLPPAPENQPLLSPTATSHPFNPISHLPHSEASGKQLTSAPVAPIAVHSYNVTRSTEGQRMLENVVSSDVHSQQHPVSGLTGSTGGEVGKLQQPASFTLADIQQQQHLQQFTSQFSAGGSSTSDWEPPPTFLGVADSHSTVADPSQQTNDSTATNGGDLSAAREWTRTQADTVDSFHRPSLETPPHVGNLQPGLQIQSDQLLPPPAPSNPTPPIREPSSQTSPPQPAFAEKLPNVTLASAMTPQIPPPADIPLHPLPTNPYHTSQPQQMAPPPPTASYSSFPPGTTSQGHPRLREQPPGTTSQGPQTNPKLQGYPPATTSQGPQMNPRLQEQSPVTTSQGPHMNPRLQEQPPVTTSQGPHMNPRLQEQSPVTTSQVPHMNPRLQEYPPVTISQGQQIDPKLQEYPATTSPQGPQMNLRLQEHPQSTTTTADTQPPPPVASTIGQSAPYGSTINPLSQVLHGPPDHEPQFPPIAHNPQVQQPPPTQPHISPTLPPQSTSGSAQPPPAVVPPFTHPTSAPQLVPPKPMFSRGPLTTTSRPPTGSSQAATVAGEESRVTNTAVLPATTQSHPPLHDDVPPTDGVSSLQHVGQGDHGRTDSIDTYSAGTQDRGGRDHYDYNRMPRYDERHGHGYADYYQDRHGSYGDHYREREDPHYWSDRMRTAPLYRDQDHYTYENRPRAHSRAPYDPYDRASESYPEYSQRYDYEDTYGRQYDYHGRYQPHEEEYYHRRGGDFYYEGDRRYHYDDRYYDPRYDNYHGQYPADPRYDPRVQHSKHDTRSQYGDYEYGHEYPHGYNQQSQYQQTQHQSQYYETPYAEDQYGEQHQQEQEGHPSSQPSQYTAEDPEASAIYGRQDNFEISQTFVDSPHTKLPQHTAHMQHESTAYYDQSVYAGADTQYHQQMGDQYEHADGSFEQQQYYEEQQPPEEYYDKEEPPWAPIESTPSPPARETPELFAHPHLRASFGFGGQLITLLPNNPRAHQPAVVEIHSVKDLVVDASTTAFIEEVEASPGPLLPGSTPKSEAVRYASKEAEKCREKLAKEENVQVAKSLEDEALLWDFLVLLCQQNGVVLPSDIVELLMKDRTISMKSPTHIVSAEAQEESLAAYRQLLLTGRKKDALSYACSKSLWGHAVMLASRMDEQSRIYVVNRFAASLMTTDPLNTFYTLLLGQTPSVVKPDGLTRAGDWRPHLAMILSNRNSKLDNASIIAMADSLLSHGRLHAAHLCYHLGHVHFGAYGNTNANYSLLGVDHSHLGVGSYPRPSELCKMEVYEFAMSLSKQDFSLPSFQLFKYLNVLKLVEVGLVAKALKYCEQISYSVIKGPQYYTPSFLFGLVELSAKLHHIVDPIGVVETELPSWIMQLHQALSETFSADYTPSLRSSPSPAFSSVSQTYSSQPPVIGVGQYLTVPVSVRGSADVSTANSSKEGSMVNLQVNVPSSSGAQQPSALAIYSTQVGQQPQHQLDGTDQTATGSGEPYDQFASVPPPSTVAPVEQTAAAGGEKSIATGAGVPETLEASQSQVNMQYQNGTITGYASVYATQAQNVPGMQEGGVYMYQQGGGEYSQVPTSTGTASQLQYTQSADPQQTYGSYNASIMDIGGGDQRSQPQPFLNQTESAPSTDPSQMAYSTYPDGVHQGAVPEGQTDASGHYMQQQEYGSGEQHQEQTQNERTDGGNEPPQAATDKVDGENKESKEKKPGRKSQKGKSYTCTRRQLTCVQL